MNRSGSTKKNLWRNILDGELAPYRSSDSTVVEVSHSDQLNCRALDQGLMGIAWICVLSSRASRQRMDLLKVLTDALALYA